MNPLVAYHRQHVPNDTRSDEELTLLFGDSYPGQYDNIPEFKTEYDELSRQRRMAVAPSLATEVSRGVSRGVAGLKSTLYGAGALAAGAVGAGDTRQALLDKAKEAEEVAQENAPTIQGIQDIRSGSDIVRYGLAGIGELSPMIVEAGTTAVAGALAGSAVSPGPGTAIGFIGGILERRAIRELAKAGVREATKEAVTNQVRNLAGRYGANIATALNSYALSAGELYSDLANNRHVDPSTALNTSLLGGLVSAVPDTILPSYVVGKYFKGVPAKTANGYVAKLFSETAKEVPIEALTEGFQEFVGIAAEKYADPTKRDKPLDKDDWNRIANAAALGGVGGSLASSATAVLEGRGKPTVAPGMENLVGDVTPERLEEIEDLARRDVTGTATIQDKQAIKSLEPEDRNLFSVIRPQVEEEIKAAPTSAPKVPDVTSTIEELLGDPEELASAPIEDDAEATQVRQPVGLLPERASPSSESSRRLAIEALRGGETVEDQLLRQAIARRQQQNPVPTPEPQPTIENAPDQAQPEPLPAPAILPPEQAGDVVLPGGIDSRFDQVAAQPHLQIEEGLVPQEHIPALQTAVTGQTKALQTEIERVQGLRKGFEDQLQSHSAVLAKKYEGRKSFEYTKDEAKVGDDLGVEIDRVDRKLDELKRRLGILQGPDSVRVMATADGILDQLDFERGTVTDRNRHHDIGSVIESIESPEPAKLGHQLNRGNRAPDKEGNQNRQLSKRALAVRDNQTGRVLILGTTTNRGFRIANPDMSQRDGTLLEKLGDRYTPLFSLRFANQMTFRERRMSLSEPQFNELVRRTQETAAAFASSRDTVQSGLESELKPTEATTQKTEEEIEGDLHDIILEALPMDRAGKVRSDLSLKQFTESVLQEFESDSDSKEAQRYAAKRLLVSKVNDTAFGKMTRDQQQQSIVKELLEQLYEAYRKGAFTEEGRPGKIQGHDRGRSGDPVVGQLQRVAELAEGVQPGVGRSEAGTSIEDSAQQIEEQSSEPGNQIPDRASGEDVRFRTVTEPDRTTSPNLRRAFVDLSSTLQAAGVNVQLFQTRLDDELARFFQREGGAYDRASNTVAVVLDDLNNPSIENLRTLLHEAGHYLFAGETPERQAQILKAIDSLTDAELGIVGSADARINSANPGGLDATALLEERLVEHLALKGEPDRTVASRIIRFLKEIYLRAAMAFQSALLGAERVSPALALQYFETRFNRLRTGERNMTLLDFLGGPRWAKDAHYRAFDRVDSVGKLNGYFDARTGTWNFRDVLPDSPDAIRFNIESAKLRDLTGTASEQPATPDQSEWVKAPHIIANNTHSEVLTKMYDEWVRAGGNATATGQTKATREEFIQHLLETNLPEEVIAAANAELQANGKPPINPRLSLRDVNPETQRESSMVALRMAHKLYGKLSERRTKAEAELNPNIPKSLQARFNKRAQSLHRLLTDYTNAEMVLRQAKDFIRDQFTLLSGDRKNQLPGLGNTIKDTARKAGELTQTIEQIEGRMDDPIARQYQSAISKLYKLLSGNTEFEGRFIDILTTLAEQNVDWRGIKTREAKAIIKVFAEKDATLSPLAEDTVDGKALLSMALAFARSNQLAMDALRLRRSNVTAERVQVNQILQDALTDHKDAISDARKKAEKLPKLAAIATSMLDELERLKTEQHQSGDELQRLRMFTDAHDAGGPVLQNHISNLENSLGAVTFIFEPSDDPKLGKYIVPNTVNDTPQEVLANRKQFKRSRSYADQTYLKNDLRMMQAYIDAHPDGGNVVAQLKDQMQKIEESLFDHQHRSIKTSFTIKLLGSITDKMRLIGLTTTLAIAKRINVFESLRHRWKADAETLGHRWTKAEAHAMNVLGMPMEQRDLFRRRYLDGSFDHITRRKDLLYSSKDLATAEVEALKSLRIELLKNPSTAKDLAKPGAWDALENYIRETARVSNETVKIAAGMGIKVEDEGIFRDVKGAPMFEAMRRLNGDSRMMYEEMASAWLANPLDIGGIAPAYSSNPTNARASLSPYFAGNTWERFVKPLAMRQGSAAFNAPADASGIYQRATVAQCRQALAATKPGDIVGFAENLYQLCGGQSDLGEFVAETVSTANNFFKSLHSVYQKESVTQKYSLDPIQHILMHARVSDEFPRDWLEYRPYDIDSMRGMVQHLAQHAAFGRDMLGVEADFVSASDELATRENILREARRNVQEKFPAATPKQRIAEITKIVEAQGHKLADLERASQHLAILKSEQKTFENWVKTENGMHLEMKTFAEIMGAAVALVVQGPATALTDTISMFKPLTESGVSVTGAKQVASNLSSFAGEAANSFLSLFGASAKFNADYARRRHELGVFDTAQQATLKDRITSIMMQVPKTEGMTIGERARRATIIGARVVRAGLSTGVGKGTENAYGFKPQALFTWTGQLMHAATIDGVWRTYEDMVLRAVQHFRQHPNHLNDPNFEFTAEQLGYTKKLMGVIDDGSSFQYLTDKLHDYGLDLKALARDFIERKAQNQNASTMSDTAYQRLAVIGPNELLLDSSVTNRPGQILTNPILRFCVPLVGWSLSQVTSTAKSFRDARYQADAKTLRKGLVGFAAMMTLGLAYSLLRDEYDEDVLGKKGNVMGFTPVGILDRLSRVGTLGMVGDIANSVINVDTAREFSVDSRVFAVSSLLGLKNAVSAWYLQGDATYATVWRPIATALGGSGYLQYADILNNALDLDNAESRVVARINAGNYLRAAGRELGMEVRTGRGMATLPTKIKPWITEMTLATYANDPMRFQEAYRYAVQAAKEMGNADPVDYVKRSYQTAHPLRSIFKTAPSESDYSRLLRQMSDRGRGDVGQAVKLFNNFGEVLGIKEFEGKTSKVSASPLGADRLRSMGLEAIRGGASRF